MNFPGLVLFIVLLVAVELTVFSWACHEKPKNKDDDLSANDRRHQEGHSRMMSAIPPHIANGDRCIELFSVNGQAPIFPRGNTVPICQRVPESKVDAEYATLFDTRLGIPRYSIYSVDPDKVKKIRSVERKDKWHQTSGLGIVPQGSKPLYENQQGPPIYQKGHVAPFNILSYSEGSGLASFAYTNAVPQVDKFNIGSWKIYEGRIVKYAKERCRPVGGTLYLITGISEAHIQGVGAAVQAVQQPMLPFMQSIAIPNSMWTVGCCVQPGQVVFGAFAGIGNNQLPDPKGLVPPMQTNLGVTNVEQLIRDGANDQSIELFPGNPDCYDFTKQVDLP